jgi:hypothetical protein
MMGTVALIRLRPANLRLPQQLWAQMMRRDQSFPRVLSLQLRRANWSLPQVLWLQMKRGNPQFFSISEPTATITQSNDNYNNRDRSLNDVRDKNEMEFDIENALACAEIGRTKEAVAKEKMVREVTWAVPERDFSNMKEDENDACRHFSISKVLPEQRPWIPRKQLIRFPTKVRARKHEKDEGRAKWKTRHAASKYINHEAVFNLAQARRSALIMSLEVDVGTGEFPKKWPTVHQGDEKFAFGLCDLPPLPDRIKRIFYANKPPVCSPILQVAEIPAANPAHAPLAAQFGNTHTPDIQIPMPESPQDTPTEVRRSASARDLTETMAWTGYMHASAVPHQLRNAPDICFIYRQIMKDITDDNEVIGDSYTMLYTEKHLSKKLCSEPHHLGVTLFYW